MTVATPECIGGESSPSAARSSSAESNFRELDDAFLQTQTRIWLGEVLQIRFDETNICDILADGELLFELSEVLPRMSPSLPVDTTQSKSNDSKSLASNKSTRRYMPYYNVGSFLKMCKNLGLNGIDLFSPSDVVEKRNTRKVCMCIRSLSKKARSRDLNVPDFDSVTRTLSMPTDMVECLRKSLEMSQCNSSLSVQDEIETSSGIRCWKRISGPVSAVNNGYSSDLCDDADSSFVVGDSNGHADTCDAKSSNMSYSEAVTDDGLAIQLSVRGLENEEEDQCEYLSPTIAESVGSPYSQYFSDQEVNMPSYDCFGSHISGKVELSSKAEPTYVNGDLPHVPINWGVGDTIFGDHSYDHDYIEKTDCAFQSLVTDIACINGGSSTDNSPSEVECEKSSCVEQVSCTNAISFEGRDSGGAHEYVSEGDFNASGFPFANIEDSYVGSDAAIHSLVADVSFSDGKGNDPCSEVLVQRSSYVWRPIDNSDFSSSNGEIHSSQICMEVVNDVENSLGDDLNNRGTHSEDFPGEIMSQVEQSPSQMVSPLPSCKIVDQLAVKSNGIDNNWIPPQSVDQSESSGQLSVSHSILASAEAVISLPRNDKEVSDVSEFSEHSHHDANRSSDMSHMCGNASVSRDFEKDSGKCSQIGYSGASNSSVPINVDDAVLVNSFTSLVIDPQLETESPGNVDSTSLVHPQLTENEEKESSENIKQVGDSNEIQQKPQRKLLKSVVKGTALVGIAVFLLHLRKNKDENQTKARKQPVEVLKQRTPEPASKRGQKGGNTSSVYPAEKLNFGM